MIYLQLEMVATKTSRIPASGITQPVNFSIVSMYNSLLYNLKENDVWMKIVRFMWGDDVYLRGHG